MPDKQIITVYGDFNCPYSYALNERLLVYARDFEIRWMAMQHLPFASDSAPRFQEQTQLTAEVASLRKKAPEIQMVTPPFRPNTGLANEFLAACELRRPSQVARLRNQIFRGLWRNGEDISRPDVLVGLARQAGAGTLEPGRDDEELSSVWQSLWEEGRFDRRIPSMENSSGGRILGFPAIPRLMSFLQGQVDEDVLLGASCEIQARRRVMVVGNNVGLVQPMADEFAIERAEYSDDLELLSLEAAQTDLVVLDGSDERHKPLCIRLQSSELTQHIPIVVYNQEADERREIEALSMGAVDYLHGAQDPVVWLARSRGLARNKQSTELLGKLARIDGLTEIPNRREFDRVLEIEWLRAVRGNDPLSLLMIDIDNFKAYNDTYGHDAGDDCIRQVALSIQSTLGRGADFVARYGGEELVCVLPDTEREGALIMADKVRQAIESLNIPHELANGERIVTVSTGVASCVASARMSPVELLKAADGALYKAKESGRNCVRAA
jgi:diguanylate cyclase (GGDEF)-like protein